VSPKRQIVNHELDSSYAYQQFGFVQVSSAALAAHQQLYLDITIPTGGYLYTYVANESNVSASTSVYFDDFTIIHTRSTPNLQVLQTSDYYPFGLTFNSYSKVSSLENRYLYNQGTGEKTFNTERVSDFNLNVDQSKYRTYDYLTGGWWQVDPLADLDDLVSFTPYNYSFNNPIRFNDPYGDCPCLVYPIGVAVLEGLTAVAGGTAIWLTAKTFGKDFLEAMGNASPYSTPAVSTAQSLGGVGSLNSEAKRKRSKTSRQVNGTERQRG